MTEANRGAVERVQRALDNGLFRGSTLVDAVAVVLALARQAPHEAPDHDGTGQVDASFCDPPNDPPAFSGYIETGPDWNDPPDEAGKVDEADESLIRQLRVAADAPLTEWERNGILTAAARLKALSAQPPSSDAVGELLAFADKISRSGQATIGQRLEARNLLAKFQPPVEGDSR